MTSVPFQDPKGTTKPEGRSPGMCILKEKKKRQISGRSDLEFLITPLTQHHELKTHGSSQTDGNSITQSDELIFVSVN